MMISGVSSSNSISFNPAASRPTAQPAAGDQVAMSISADTFSSLVQDASNMPEVRSELVDSYKSRIQSGTYPSQDTLDGLVDKMGGAWARMAEQD